MEKDTKIEELVFLLKYVLFYDIFRVIIVNTNCKKYIKYSLEIYTINEQNFGKMS